MLSAYIGQQEYIPEWILMHPPQPTTSPSHTEGGLPVPQPPRPGMRGGHQMCLDPASETIFLFGGWDGNQDLSDLWSYHIPSQTWRLISPDTSAEVIIIPPSTKKLTVISIYLTVCSYCREDQVLVHVISFVWIQTEDRYLLLVDILIFIFDLHQI